LVLSFFSGGSYAIPAYSECRRFKDKAKKSVSEKSVKAAPAEKKAAPAVSAVPNPADGWPQVQKFLAETEQKLADFERRLDATAEKVGEKTTDKIEEFEGHWLKALDWMQEKDCETQDYRGEGGAAG